MMHLKRKNKNGIPHLQIVGVITNGVAAAAVDHQQKLKIFVKMGRIELPRVMGINIGGQLGLIGVFHLMVKAVLDHRALQKVNFYPKIIQ